MKIKMFEILSHFFSYMQNSIEKSSNISNRAIDIWWLENQENTFFSHFEKPSTHLVKFSGKKKVDEMCILVASCHWIFFSNKSYVSNNHKPFRTPLYTKRKWCISIYEICFFICLSHWDLPNNVSFFVKFRQIVKSNNNEWIA